MAKFLCKSNRYLFIKKLQIFPVLLGRDWRKHAAIGEQTVELVMPAHVAIGAFQDAFFVEAPMRAKGI